jgi:hypothetical protein
MKVTELKILTTPTNEVLCTLYVPLLIFCCYMFRRSSHLQRAVVKLLYGGGVTQK